MRICVFCGLALAQIGEFSFVLAKSGLDAGVIQEAVYQLFLAGAIVTMILTPFAMLASPTVVDLLYRLFPNRIAREKNLSRRRNVSRGSDLQSYHYRRLLGSPGKERGSVRQRLPASPIR